MCSFSLTVVLTQPATADNRPPNLCERFRGVCLEAEDDTDMSLLSTWTKYLFVKTKQVYALRGDAVCFSTYHYHTDII